MQLLKRIATAAVLIPIVLLLILRAPIPVLAFVAAFVALLTVSELLKLAEVYGIRPFYRPTYVFVALFFVLLAINPRDIKPLLSTAIFIYTTGFAAAIAAFVFLVIGMRSIDLRRSFPAAAVSVFAFCYVALPLGFMVQVREQWSGAFLLLYLLLVVWAGDIFAYFIGKPFGRHRMSPRVSPNKTWEGAVASVLASIAVGVLMFHYAVPISRALLHSHLIELKDGVFQETPLLPVIVLSIVLNIAAQLGDLLESLIKRGVGAKDSGSILPGHGGMLDRIDALLFAAPVLWCYAAWQVMTQ